VRHRHRLDQRHRPGHRPRPGPGCVACDEDAQLGRIVNIASTHGLVASVEKSAYSDDAAQIRSAAVPVGGAWLAQ